MHVTMKLLILPFLLIGSCFAQHGITYSTKITTHSHGGFPLLEHFGANRGDIVNLDAICDGWLDSDFFFGPPQLTGDPLAFARTITEEITCPTDAGWFQNGAKCWHEHWIAKSPSTGDQYVYAQYLFLGTDAHYRVRIVSSENQ